MSTSQHPSTRRKGGRPARQRHAHARAAKSRTKSTSSAATNQWSKHVNETSDAMDIESGVFKSDSAEAIARSLKESSLRSRRRKGTPFQSAMSMLNFYINRAGKKPAPIAARHAHESQGKTARSVWPQTLRENRRLFHADIGTAPNSYIRHKTFDVRGHCN